MPIYYCPAVAPWMGGEREGVIITTIPPSAAMAIPDTSAISSAAPQWKPLSTHWPANWGEKYPRARRTVTRDSGCGAGGFLYCRGICAKAQALGLSVEQWLGGAAHGTMLQRLPTLEQIAGVITFLASPSAAAMTATVVNVTAGATLS